MPTRTCRVIFSYLFPFVFLICGFTLRAQAQTQRGSIGGTVTDATGAGLQGVLINIQNPALTASTNEQGRFYINDLAPGSYTVTISYFGLETQTKTVTVVAGQTATADSRLEIPSQKQAVVVTAARASAEVEAINEERAADNLLLVLPVVIITSLPNANLADALGRCPA